MIRVAAWSALFFALCILSAWLAFKPFPFHGLLAVVSILAMLFSLAKALIALAHAVNEVSW